MAPATTRRQGGRGFTLVEAVVALGIFAVFAAGVMPLFVTARNALATAEIQGMTALLASAKLHQLRSLPWGYVVDSHGVATEVVDTTTDLSTEPPGHAGRGLLESPAETLWLNTRGYADFLDGAGRWLGAGTDPPRGARYVRRWSITRRPGSPDTLVVQVMAAASATDILDPPRSGPQPRRGDTWLASLLTRTRR